MSLEHGLALNEWEVLLRLGRAAERRLKRVELVGQLLLTPSGIAWSSGALVRRLRERDGRKDDRSARHLRGRKALREPGVGDE